MQRYKGELRTADHWRARLDRDRPDLARKVRAKEISPNAAAIEAGFRKKARKLTHLERITKLLGKLSEGEKERLLG